MIYYEPTFEYYPQIAAICLYRLGFWKQGEREGYGKVPALPAVKSADWQTQLTLGPLGSPKPSEEDADRKVRGATPFSPRAGRSSTIKLSQEWKQGIFWRSGTDLHPIK